MRLLFSHCDNRPSTAVVLRRKGDRGGVYVEDKTYNAAYHDDSHQAERCQEVANDGAEHVQHTRLTEVPLTFIFAYLQRLSTLAILETQESALHYCKVLP
jgi:hypothetical protein